MDCICNEDYTVKTEYSAITRWDGDNNLTHDLEPVKNLKNNLQLQPIIADATNNKEALKNLKQCIVPLNNQN